MFDITTIETDTKAELEGIWRPYKDGSELLIARTNNPKYRSLLRSKVKANRAILDNEDDLSDKVGEEVLNDVFSRTILLGWKGIVDKDGKEIPYSHEKALFFISKSREFREAVKNYAEDSEAYRVKVENAAVKN